MLVMCVAHLPAAESALSSPDAINDLIVRRQEIRTNLVGDLYLPARAEQLPGIILLGGSDGEPMKERSTLLAAQGYAVLNLFYFGHDPLPRQFAKVPLEYLTNAVSWLQAREGIDPGRIGIIGYSRGTEAALLMATLSPAVRAAVAVAPSSVVWPGPGPSGYFHSAWSLDGKELPCVPVTLSKGLSALFKEVAGGTQIEHRPLFEDALKNRRAVERAAIPVENMHGALLLISGKDDRVWPSSSMAEQIVARLRAHKFAFTCRHLSYVNAGHTFGLPNRPRTNDATGTLKMGGTPAGNAEAAVHSWQAVLQFLDTELRNRGERPAPGSIHFFVDPATNSDDPEQRRAYGLSVIPPWPYGGWLFINLPEHLEYMPGTRGIARHHDKRQNVWQISGDGAEASFAVESVTEPGVFFSVRARADGDQVRFEMSITNRSAKTLRSIRPLLCFQYHHLQGFPAANSDNFAHTFVVVGGKPVAVADLSVKRPKAYARMAQVKGCADAHNWWAAEMGGFIEQPLDLALTVLTAANDDRKIVVAWRPGKNLLTNAAIPCIHADPCFGDIRPGEARTVHGELIFTRAPLARAIAPFMRK
jgi:dienelactone hydrolase